MLLDIEGISVIFPFDYIYPEQLRYMRELKYSIENKGKHFQKKSEISKNRNLKK